MPTMWLIPRLFLILAALVAPCASRITEASIVEDSRSSIVLSNPFGFTARGEPVLQFNVSDAAVIWKAKTPDKDKDFQCFKFYLVFPLYDAVDMETPDGMCAPDDATPASPMFITSFNQHTVAEDDGEERIEDFFIDLGTSSNLFGGLHTLYFANCCPNKAEVSFDIVIDMYNIINGDKSYLSLGEIELPSMYLIMCISFTVGLALWCYTVYINKSSAQKIHYMMIVLGFFKVVTLLAQCGMYHYIRITGHPDGWNVAYYIFTFFRSILLFSIIVLIGTGWSYMTPFLGDNEKRVLMIVLPFQVLTDVAIVVIDELTPASPSWFQWRDLMHFVDIICCCAVLFPIAWRIRHLHEASATDGKAERSMQQLIMFRHFYIMVVVYIYFTRIVVYLLDAALPADYAWLAPAAEELATLLFYTLTAIQFQPHQSNSYTKLVTEAEIELNSFGS